MRGRLLEDFYAVVLRGWPVERFAGLVSYRFRVCVGPVGSVQGENREEHCWASQQWHPALRASVVPVGNLLLLQQRLGGCDDVLRHDAEVLEQQLARGGS